MTSAAERPAGLVVADAPARPVPHTVEGPYVGLVTRVLAFAVDAAVINGVALAVGGAVSLFVSVVEVPDSLDAALVAVGGVAWVLWTIGYFVTFWSTTGQTIGGRLLRFRVMAREGGRLKPRRSLLRFAALTLAALPLFAGFLLILVDDRRRALQDWIARTVVVEAPPEAPAATRSRAPARRSGP